MFPMILGLAGGGTNFDALTASRRETQPLSRIETQRLLLEYAKMYHLDSMSVDVRADDRNRDLARRQMLALARRDRVTLVSRIRRSFGGTLISIGERIRPELVSSEPTFNA